MVGMVKALSSPSSGFVDTPGPPVTTSQSEFSLKVKASLEELGMSSLGSCEASSSCGTTFGVLSDEETSCESGGVMRGGVLL